MLFEPFFGALEVGAEAGDFAPEASRVVHFFQVSQLVQDDVIADENGSLYEAPIQGNRSAPGTGTPTGTLIADGDSGDLELVQGGQFHNARRQFARGELAEVALHSGAQVGGGKLMVGELMVDGRTRGSRSGHDALLRKTNHEFASLNTRFQPYRFAAEEDLRSGCPNGWVTGLRGLSQKLPFQPGEVFVGKLFGFRD